MAVHEMGRWGERSGIDEGEDRTVKMDIECKRKKMRDAERFCRVFSRVR
jgi:hypothetical protein